MALADTQAIAGANSHPWWLVPAKNRVAGIHQGAAETTPIAGAALI